MLRKDLLIHKTRELLNEFLTPLLQEVDKPRKRFLQQGIRGILFSGSPVVMEGCRWVRDDGSDRFYRVKRLLNHWVSPEGDLAAAVRSYRQAALSYVEPDTALILDRTDLAKPRAKKMRYVDLVHDGSEDQLVWGTGASRSMPIGKTNGSCLWRWRSRGSMLRRSVVRISRLSGWSRPSTTPCRVKGSGSPMRAWTAWKPMKCGFLSMRTSWCANVGIAPSLPPAERT